MHAVIFEVEPEPERRQDYLDIAARLRPELEKIDGFISVERFESLTSAGKDPVAVVLARRGGGGRVAAARGAPRGAACRPRRHLSQLSAARRRRVARLRDE